MCDNGTWKGREKQMAHFLTVVPILIIGVYMAGMCFVMLRFFSPSLNEHPNYRIRNLMLWTLGVGPLLLCIGFSLKLLFQLSLFFWLVLPVLISFLGGLYFAFKKQNQ